ncbi:RloB domain-containing protein, partial [Fusobacterium mortiferum]|nr:RloB domain-containing protein [Fusobacterium mortiferum]
IQINMKITTILNILSQKGEVAKELQRYLKINELSRAKTFNKKILFEHYIDRIDNAIRVAKKYEDDIEKLKDKLGTNVYQLVEKINYIRIC